MGHHMMHTTMPSMDTTMNMSGNMTGHGMTGHDHGGMHGGATAMSGHGGAHGGGAPGGAHVAGHNMKMFFNSDYSDPANQLYVLFYTLRITTGGELAGACVAMFILGVFYEGLKVLREHLLTRTVVFSPQDKSQMELGESKMSDIGSSNTTMVKTTQPSAHRSPFSWGHVIQSLLHMVQVMVSYFLMLVVMTFNIWLFVSVALGAGTGYFLFGWMRSIVIDQNEHCN